MFRVPVITLKKNWSFLSSWCPFAGTEGKLTETDVKRLSSHFFNSNLMQSQSHYLNQLYMISSIVILFKATSV